MQETTIKVEESAIYQLLNADNTPQWKHDTLP